jgi:signal transduction histidine kinase
VARKGQAGGQRKLLRAATRSAQRGARLAQQLLAFSRKQRAEAKPVDLNATVSGMSDMLRRTLSGAVDLRTKLDSALWRVHADQTQIEVALLNLAINARDAMPKGGTLEIATRNVAVDGTNGPEDLPCGDYVAVSVADSGQGRCAEDVLSKAFSPFFTTKEVGKGTGLGLPQVYRLARQSAGTARIRSRSGKGTTVEIYLPRHGGEPA